MDESKVRKLKSSDGKIFEVDEKIIAYAKVLEGCLKDYPDPDQEIPTNQVDAKNLEKIIEYLKHYDIEKPKVIPKPLPSNDLKSFVNEWDFNFINPLTIEECIDLINAANFLDIADLVTLVAARLAADMMTGPVEEVRERFGIKPDMTEEEMEEYDRYPLD